MQKSTAPAKREAISTVYQDRNIKRLRNFISELEIFKNENCQMQCVSLMHDTGSLPFTDEDRSYLRRHVTRAIDHDGPTNAIRDKVTSIIKQLRQDIVSIKADIFVVRICTDEHCSAILRKSWRRAGVMATEHGGVQYHVFQKLVSVDSELATALDAAIRVGDEQAQGGIAKKQRWSKQNVEQFIKDLADKHSAFIRGCWKTVSDVNSSSDEIKKAEQEVRTMFGQNKLAEKYKITKRFIGMSATWQNVAATFGFAKNPVTKGKRIGFELAVEEASQSGNDIDVFGYVTTIDAIEAYSANTPEIAEELLLKFQNGAMTREQVIETIEMQNNPISNW